MVHIPPYLGLGVYESFLGLSGRYVSESKLIESWSKGDHC